MPDLAVPANQLVSALEAAIEDPRWEFRSVEGLAGELGVSTEAVEQMLHGHPEIARKSALTDKQGRHLYAPRDRSPTIRERLERARWVLAR